MSSPSSAPAAITVIGDGLAGSVLALCLAARGVAVRLLSVGEGTATALSYGALPRGRPSRAWRHLEHLHGPLGWQPSGLVFHDSRPGLPHRLAALTQRLPIPLARVDATTWMAAREEALAAAGVQHLCRRVLALNPLPRAGWRLELAPVAGAESALEADTVVLAAGAACRSLWPGLPPQLRHSWAGVLLLEPGPVANPWLDQARRGRIVQPRHWRRPALEAASVAFQEPQWIVDAGLAPRGDGVVVGQISWIPPASEAAAPGHRLPHPDPAWMEERLREGLALLDPDLAALAAPYRQVPVSFCSDGQPLVGPVAGAPGLWTFAGFSAAFSRVPSQAEALATRLLASHGLLGQDGSHDLPLSHP